MLRIFSGLTVAFFVSVWGWAAAGDSAALQPLLERAILDADQAVKEVQTYCETRVPPMPMAPNAAEWEKHAARIRQQVLDRVVFRGEAAAWRDATTKVEWLDAIEGGPGYHIKKLRYEALPGLWIPALLYEPDKLDGKVPVVMNVNGHDGNGKAARYKQIRCINQAKRGMIALNPEWLGMGQLSGDGYRHSRMNQLDLCGTSGLAPFYLAMKRGLDVLLSHEHADPGRVAVAGLSGGGWQTIIISSLDTRVKLCNPVAGYSSFRTRARFFSDLGDSEQTPCDLATVADYEHLTALLAPNPALLTYNIKDDCCFAADHALPPLLDAARPIYRLYGKELNLRPHVNHHPGTHNFERENREALYRMFGDFFHSGVKDFDSAEILSDAEVKTKEQLQVTLPADNENFQSLAQKLAKGLPRSPVCPSGEAEAAKWRQERRAKLAEVVRAKPYQVEAQKVGTEEKDGLTCTFWRLKVGEAWTVPAVELARGKPQKTVLLVADEGRKSTASVADQLLASERRVIVVDPFYFGESKPRQRDYLFALLVATIGDRPMGIQASQLVAIARWCRQVGNSPVTLGAVGPRSSTLALVAAALEPEAIGDLELRGALGGLSEVIEKKYSYEQAPELFCFGLLEQFEIRDMLKLAEPRAVKMQ